MAAKVLNENHSRSLLALAFMVWVFSFMFCSKNIYAQDSEKELKLKAFKQVFGDAVNLDPVMVEKVKADVHGKRHYVDTNGDGKPNEVWFIDIEPRHNDKYRPLLVKVIDENGSLEYGNEPDKYGDLWIADWNADGMVDAVIGYEDDDNDGDVDHMGMYFFDQKLGLRVWWFIDDGDDNLLGYDVDYVYYQIPCQDHTHFGGNESLISMYFNSDMKMWIPFWENPFLFYDSDDDGITEEVVRVEGEADIMRYLRWSFNVNPLEGELRNYDVGITACAPGWTEEKDRDSDFTFRLSDEHTESFTLRDRPTGSVIKRSTARDVLNSMQWARVLMTWDENDLNTAWDRPGDKIERWEGIISAASREPGYYMPQVGGPDCGPFNKRYELVLNPEGTNEFYFNPSDHKIHIKNSDKTWIDVDYNGDLKTDMHYTWVDRNNDGVMDHIKIDIVDNVQFSDSIDLDVSNVESIQWQFKDFNRLHMPVLKKEPENKYNLIKHLTALLEMNKKEYGADRVWNFVENKMRGQEYTEDLSTRLLNSDESILYYLMLIQDRQIAKLKKSNLGSPSFWKAFNKARSRGNTQAMTIAIKKHFKLNPQIEEYTIWLSNLRAPEEKQRVAWSNDWLPPNWGWESEKMAFRFYDGHIDLFGKRVDTLIYPKIKEGKSYHKDQNGWGMDILHVGETGGIGGLTLYVNGVSYSVRNDKNLNDPIFTGKLVSESLEEITLEFTTNNVGPKTNPYTIKIRPSAIAGHYESPVEVVIEGGSPDDHIELGIGLTRLHEEEFFYDKNIGIMGNWGFQEPEIGWIGMGVIFSPDGFIRIENVTDEHRVVVKCEHNVPLTYYIRGEWLRGNQFPCCPAPTDWFKKLKTTAQGLNSH